MNKAYSIGVIGGADGPTAIFVTGRFPWELLLLGAICVGAVIWYFKRKK
jgi:Na+-transporting methylmalonyl-CoA/oxaloacetate decarboxylase beta subunit